MADKKKPAEGGPVSDAKATDPVAGKKAAPQGAAESAPPAKAAKIPKLAKKGKSRLPRRVKKARRKAEERSS